MTAGAFTWLAGSLARLHLSTRPKLTGLRLHRGRRLLRPRRPRSFERLASSFENCRRMRFEIHRGSHSSAPVPASLRAQQRLQAPLNHRTVCSSQWMPNSTMQAPLKLFAGASSCRAHRTKLNVIKISTTNGSVVEQYWPS